MRLYAREVGCKSEIWSVILSHNVKDERSTGDVLVL